MKYVKVTLGVLLVTILTTGFSVFATTGHYSIKLKSLMGATELGPKTKEREGTQSYYNIGTVNTCTSNRNTVKVMVRSERNGESDWIQVTDGATSSWTGKKGQPNTVNAYNLFIKNDIFIPCEANHSGTWYLDR